MGYKTLKDRRVSVTFEGYPWDHTLILQGILEAMQTMVDVTNLGKIDECVKRSHEGRQNINRTIEILKELLNDSIRHNEKEDSLYEELFDILRSDIQGWWN